MKIKAVKIDAMRFEVTEVVIESDKLDDFYTHIGCMCMDHVRPGCLTGNDTLFVDDEGLINDRHKVDGRKRGFVIDGYPTPLVGNGLIVGANAAGESRSAHTLVESVRARVSFGAYGAPS